MEDDKHLLRKYIELRKITPREYMELRILENNGYMELSKKIGEPAYAKLTKEGLGLFNGIKS